MGRLVIVAHTPRAGKEALLPALVEKHLRVSRAEQLVSDKPAHVMRAADGTIVEVFEWLSAEAIERAHKSPSINALWAELAAVCDSTPLAKLSECNSMFAEFESVSFRAGRRRAPITPLAREFSFRSSPRGPLEPLAVPWFIGGPRCPLRRPLPSP